MDSSELIQPGLCRCRRLSASCFLVVSLAIVGLTHGQLSPVVDHTLTVVAVLVGVLATWHRWQRHGQAPPRLPNARYGPGVPGDALGQTREKPWPWTNLTESAGAADVWAT